MRLRILAALVALVAGLVLGSHGATAQQPDVKARIEAQRQILDRIDQSLARQGLDQQTLQTLRNDIDNVDDELRTIVGEIEPEVRGVNDRLRELGPRPEQGRAEAPEIAREREEIQRRLTSLDADLRQARQLLVRYDQLSDRIAEKRREILSRELFQRSPSILDPALWTDVGAAMPRLALGVGFFVQDWFAILSRAGNALGFVVLALTVIVAVLVYGPLRRRLLAAPHGGVFSWGTVERPSNVQRSIVASWTAIVNALLPALAALLVVRVLENLQLIPFRFGLVANGVVFAMVIYSGLTAITYALLSPDRPAWRFLPVSDKVATHTYRTMRLLGLITAVFYVVQQVGASIVAPLPVTIVTFAVRSILFAVVLMAGLAAIARYEGEDREARDKDPYAGPAPKLGGWRWIRLFMWVAAVLILGGGLFGYVGFSSYLAAQVVWVLIVTGGLVLILHLVDDVLSEATRAGSAGSRRVAGTFGIEQSSVEQIGIVLSGLLRMMFLVVALFMVIVPWGVDSRDALGWMRAVFFGVQVGGITISLSAVLLAVSVFTLGLFATRGIQRWLDDKYLPSTRMDVGLRNSIRTVFGYVGFVVAAIIGFSYLGVDLQNLAIVAGALSVGIGFGLQSIVSNFVSGLILLAERPIKAGDWIVVGDSEGYVRRINVRATEIETFDNAILIVPNANLVSGTVRNWMHNDLFGRAKIRVGVPHGTDPERVRDILIELSKDHPLVSCDSKPGVQLVDFTEAGLFFDLSVIVTNVDKSGQVRSDLRFAIVKRFAEEGIVIK